VKSVPLALPFAAPLSAALICWDWWNDGWTHVPDSAGEIDLCTEFDSRFDIFWDELQHQNENVLLAVRTQETLAWHFRETLARRAWILAASAGGRLTADAIFDQQDNPTIGLRAFASWISGPSRIRKRDHFVLDVAKMPGEQGVHILEVDGGWLSRPGLPRIIAPYRRPMPSWRFYCRSRDRSIADALKNPEVWAPFCFEGEASLGNCDLSC
jgi:hypothetical protein